jgi:hypothetical protein
MCGFRCHFSIDLAMMLTLGPRFNGPRLIVFWCRYECNTEHRNNPAAVKERAVH